MADEAVLEQAQEGQEAAAGQTAQADKAENMIPQSRFNEVNQKMREAERELQKLKAAQEAAEKAKLAEQQRWQELAETYQRELQDARSQAEKAQAEALRTRVAAEFKLPPVLAARLVGSTEEELRADAEALAQVVPSGKSGPGIPPVASGTGTARGKTDVEILADMFGGGNSPQVFGGE